MLRRWNLRKAACVWTISVAALCCDQSARAGINEFSPLGPRGGHIYKVLQNPTLPLHTYALTQGGYYLRSSGTNGWLIRGRELSNAPLDVAVDPTDPNRVLFAVPGESPVLSTDGGFTLTHVGNFPNVPAGLRQIEFSADGSVLYAASGVRIFRSTDGGRNWSERTAVTANTASNLQFLRVNPLDAQMIYVYDLNDGGFRSTDGGGSWQPVAIPANTVDIAITSTTPQKIWAASPSTGVHLSTDGGASWPAVLPGSALSIALDPQNQSVVYAGTSPDGLFRTADGNSWSNVQGNARVGQINSISVDPHDSTKVTLGGESGIVVGTPATTGTGGVWDRDDLGILATTGGEFSAPLGSNRVYLNTVNNGVHFQVDGNTFTNPVNNAAMNPLQPAAVTASTFALLAQARAPDRLFVGISGGYVRSDDAGNTWQPGTVGGSNTVHHFADSPGNPDLILASTFPGMHRSIDGGDSWAPVTTGLPAQPQATAMLFAEAAPNTVYAAIESTDGGCCTPRGVYKSTDGGVSWTAANAGFTAVDIRSLAIDPTNAQIVYAAANVDGLLKTTNGGASWSRLTWPNGQSNTISVAVDPHVPNIVLVGGANRFARSVDGGLTWQELRSFSATPSWQANALLAHPRRAGTLLLSTATQGVVEITIAPSLKVQGDPLGPLTTVPIGVQFTYPYEISNLGPFHATGVRFTATLPADATGISATTTQGTCLVQGTTVSCAVGLLEQAAKLNITLKAAYPTAGSKDVLWSVSGDQPDGGGGVTQGASISTVEETADLALTVSGPATALQGGAVTYTYTATNHGPNDSSSVVARITLDTGMSVPTVTTTRGACTVTLSIVDCDLGAIANGSSATITVNSAMPSSGSLVQISGRVEASSSDPNLTNGLAVIRTNASAPSSPPGSGGGGGGGGGGSSSVLWVLALALLRALRSYARPRRFSTSGVGPSNDCIATLPTYFRSFTPTGVV